MDAITRRDAIATGAAAAAAAIAAPAIAKPGAYSLKIEPNGVGAVLQTSDLALVANDPAAVAHLTGEVIDKHLVLLLCSDAPVTAASVGAFSEALLAGGSWSSAPPRETRVGLKNDAYDAGPGGKKVPGYEYMGDLSTKARPVSMTSPRIPAWIETLHNDGVAAYSVTAAHDVSPVSPYLFVDMRAVLADLPRDLKRIVYKHDGLHYALPTTTSPMALAPAFEADKATRRPLVLAHWRTGRPHLNIPKHPMAQIADLPADESREVLTELWKRANTTEDRFVSLLQSRQVVIWDNMASMHTNPAHPRDKDNMRWFFTIPGAKTTTARATVA